MSAHLMKKIGSPVGSRDLTCIAHAGAQSRQVAGTAKPAFTGLFRFCRFLGFVGFAPFGTLPHVHAAPPAAGGQPPVAADESWQVPVTLGQDGWMVYENPRFGFILPVPPGMKALRPPENGDGQAFATLDHKVKLTGWGCFNVEDLGNVESRWKAALEEPDRTITYKRKTATWFVVSGVTKDGAGFYEKYTANKHYGSGWTMTYPQADEKKLAPWIERIAAGYQPRFGKGHDVLREDSEEK